MTVELRDLRWAIVVSQHRSLRQAAEALNIQQSILSRRLRDIEYRLGAALFERTTGGTRPTAVGREFLVTARRIVCPSYWPISRAPCKRTNMLKGMSREEASVIFFAVAIGLYSTAAGREPLS